MAPLYTVFFSSAGVPQAGLTPVWLTLQDAVTTVSIPSLLQPAISEIGGGWYSFSVTPSDPWVGVLDGGVSLADTDRYKPISIPISAATAFGSVQVTITMQDVINSVPIPDVEIVVFNSDQSLIINSALSNSSGIMVLQLNPGTYILTLRKDGYAFATPQTLIVTGPSPQAVTYPGTLVGTPAPDFQAIVVPTNPGFYRES